VKWFNIPLRYTQNMVVPQRNILLQVSIPHRYSKNVEAVPGAAKLPSWFQFLIGILKTKQFICPSVIIT